MASINELWLSDFAEPYPGKLARHRPALVIGPPDTFGHGFPFVIVLPLTTVHRGLSLHVEVKAGSDTGLDETSYVQCELIRSVNRNRLLRRLGIVDAPTSFNVTSVVRTLLNH